jgi:hypothetical protein
MLNRILSADYPGSENHRFPLAPVQMFDAEIAVCYNGLAHVIAHTAKNPILSIVRCR